MCEFADECADYEKEPCDVINQTGGVVPTCLIDKPLKAQAEPVAEVPCSAGLSDLVLRVKLIKAFMDGYEAGHNDTVESAYSDAEDRANDWIDEQEEEGR